MKYIDLVFATVIFYHLLGGPISLTKKYNKYNNKNGITDACSTADILDCPKHAFRICPRHAKDMPQMMPQTCSR